MSRSACCFLYGRGFVAAMGREFYGAVAGDPEMGVPYSECEKMCHFFAHLSRERFGKFPDTDSGICRESGSNLTGAGPTSASAYRALCRGAEARSAAAGLRL